MRRQKQRNRSCVPHPCMLSRAIRAAAIAPAYRLPRHAHHHALLCPAFCLLQSLTFLWTLQITKFAVLYSIGSVLSLGRWAADEQHRWQCEQLLTIAPAAAHQLHTGPPMQQWANAFLSDEVTLVAAAAAGKSHAFMFSSRPPHSSAVRPAVSHAG